MPRFKFTGLDEYVRKLEMLTKESNRYLKEAVYKGAEVVANETKSALQSMEVDNSQGRRGSKTVRKSINEIQRIGLVESFGVTPMIVTRDLVNVKTGFDGYNRIGQANVTIARRLESGTSYMQKNPVVSRATRRARRKCEKAMAESLIKDIDEIMKG